MNTYDGTVVGIGVLGLAVWLRGCIKSSMGDCWLGLFIGAVASTFYFLLFSFTQTPWLGTLVMGVFLVSLLAFQKMLKHRSGMVAAVLLAAGVAATVVVENKILSAGNALLVIEPYRLGKGWAFDEPRLGLSREPFVEGIPEMIDRLVAGIPDADKGVRLIFSQREFPGAQLQLTWVREAGGGNWYHCDQYGTDGWLCPALSKYFPRAPRHIFVKAGAR
jgi:hypothetical protein